MMNPRWHLLNEGCGNGPLSIFFAGSGFDYDLAYQVGVRKRLLSWHANTVEDIQQFIDAQKNGFESFGMVDSGAFTVWNKGGVINVQDYAKKLVQLLEHFDVAANLDIIPGRKGMKACDITPAMNDQAASGGWENYLYLCSELEKNGIDKRRLIPIYHQGESIDWLKRMVDNGADYIGISPSNDQHTSQRQHWLDDTFDWLMKLPVLPKTHGYAVTSPVLMKQYSWFSVDSASWVQLGGYGAISTPWGPITISDREKGMMKPDGVDGSNWDDSMRQRIKDYIQSIGLDFEVMKSDFRERWKANAIFLLALEKKMTYKRRPREEGIFM